MKKRSILSNEKVLSNITDDKYRPLSELTPPLPPKYTPPPSPEVKLERKLNVVIQQAPLKKLPVSCKSSEKEVEIKELRASCEVEVKAEVDNRFESKVFLLKKIASNLIDLGLIGVVSGEESAILNDLNFEDMDLLLNLMNKQLENNSCALGKQSPYGMVEYARLVYKAANFSSMSLPLEEALLEKYKKASNLDELALFLEEAKFDACVMLSLEQKKIQANLVLLLDESLITENALLGDELIDMLGEI